MPRRANGVEHGGPGRHLDNRAGAREPHPEWLVVGRVLLRLGERLEVHGGWRPVAGHVAHRCHQPARTAAIDVALGLLEHRPEIERARGIAAVMMDHHLAAEFGAAELVAERGLLRRARAIVKLETAAGALEMADHGHDRRDADAARDERVAGRTFDQGKIVARRRDQDFVAVLRVVHQAGRSAAPGCLAQHRDDVAVALGRIVAERIFPDQSVRNAQRNVRAGRELRQVPAVVTLELEQPDVLRRCRRADNSQGRGKGLSRRPSVRRVC